MSSPWKQLHPQDSFTVKLAAPVTSQQEQVLSFLYQPIIGMDGFSIYHMLLSLIDEGAFDSHALRHADLFNQLNSDLPRLYHARTRLEGIGLLRVYGRGEQSERQFLYELLPPLTAQAFFSDDVLNLLLLDSVGERRYDQLVNRFAVPEIDTDSYEEVTKKFLDVYQFNESSLAANQARLLKTKARFKVEEPKPLTSRSSQFDWAYFVSLLEGLYIDKEQVETELKETVYTLHQLYGINEMEMKQLVEEEVDYVTNKVPLNQLRKNVVLKYHGSAKKGQQELEQEATNLSADEKVIRRQNTLALQGYSEGEIQVILFSESMSPLIFFESIKKQKGGFVANEERWAIENIVKQSSLPDAVINVLIHYILVVKSNATLSAAFANPIANDWAQDKVYSPEEAITKVKERDAKQQTKSANYGRKKSTNRKYTSNRKETLPEWAGKTKEETPVSQEEEAYFKEQLRLLRGSGKEGES